MYLKFCFIPLYNVEVSDVVLIVVDVGIALICNKETVSKV